jgi:hypothetical protein
MKISIYSIRHLENITRQALSPRPARARVGLFASPMYLLRLTTIFENGAYIRGKGRDWVKLTLPRFAQI